MEKDSFSERLKRIQDRQAAGRASGADPLSKGRRKFTQGSLAWRMVTELVVGMFLGIVLGMGLDAIFGTQPVFLVIFVILGFAAGVRTLMRTADEVKNKRAEGALLGGDDAGPDGADKYTGPAGHEDAGPKRD